FLHACLLDLAFAECLFKSIDDCQDNGHMTRTPVNGKRHHYQRHNSEMQLLLSTVITNLMHLEPDGEHSRYKIRVKLWGHDKLLSVNTVKTKSDSVWGADYIDRAKDDKNEIRLEVSLENMVYGKQISR
ncbi:hypothetical protein STEG23_006758, partial [Scotinomys teguina]